MSQALLTIENGMKLADSGVRIMDGLNLRVNKGEFVTVLGGNGAGKSTLFNAISGTLSLTKGEILLKDKRITHLTEEKRANYISRVFQDPKQGTAPRMTVAENLLLARQRGERRGFKRRQLKECEQEHYEACSSIGNGLERHLNTPTGQLSGGQRQALSLLMATIKAPELLLLDEHTAALDPKTAKQLMSLTASTIERKELTCLMITHRMEDALLFGNRLIVLEQGNIKYDINEKEKKTLTLPDLYHYFG